MVRPHDGTTCVYHRQVNKKTRFHLSYVLLALMGVLVLHEMWVASSGVETIPYSDFQRLLRDQKVASVVISEHAIEGVLKAPDNGKTRFRTTRVGTDIASELDDFGIKYAGQPENTVMAALLAWLIPVVLFVGLWMLLQRRLGGGGAGAALMSIGKSKAKVYVEHDTKVSFKDVAGVDEAKAELQEVVALPQGPEGVRPSRRPHAEGRPARRPARNRQDPARARRGG